MGEGRVRRAARLYEEGDHGILVGEALAAWPDQGPLSGDEAEMCRFASVAAWDMAKDAEPDVAARHRADADLLRARALTAAVLQGERRTVAGVLLPTFFSLVERGHGETARLVLEEWRRLLPDEVPGEEPTTFARMYFEKRGHSYLVEGRYEDAVGEYEHAADRAEAGTRGDLKVRGALALGRYLVDPDDEGQASASATTLRQVEQAARSGGFPDVERAAATNTIVVESGCRDGWVPFEVT